MMWLCIRCEQLSSDVNTRQTHHRLPSHNNKSTFEINKAFLTVIQSFLSESSEKILEEDNCSYKLVNIKANVLNPSACFRPIVFTQCSLGQSGSVWEPFMMYSLQQTFYWARLPSQAFYIIVTNCLGNFQNPLWHTFIWFSECIVDNHKRAN